jgi:hypothetical protein
MADQPPAEYPFDQSEAERFKKAVAEAQAVKVKSVDPQIPYYERNTRWPRFLFRCTGVTALAA